MGRLISITPVQRGGIVNISHQHANIHVGRSFVASDYDSNIASAVPKYWSLAAPAVKEMHFRVALGTLKGAIVQFFEGPTITVQGTALAAFNRQRNLAATPTLVIKYDPTVTVDGTQIWVKRIGSSGGGGNDSPGVLDTEHEIILKKSTDYVLKVTSDENGNDAGLTLSWYEED